MRGHAKAELASGLLSQRCSRCATTASVKNVVTSSTKGAGAQQLRRSPVAITAPNA
jgi:hypothetical protein